MSLSNSNNKPAMMFGLDAAEVADQLLSSNSNRLPGLPNSNNNSKSVMMAYGWVDEDVGPHSNSNNMLPMPHNSNSSK